MALLVSNYNRGDNARGDAYGVGGVITGVALGLIAGALGGPVAGYTVFGATVSAGAALGAPP